MVIEHAFISTAEAPEVLKSAMEFLKAHDFTPESPLAFAVDADWKQIRLIRGRKNAARAKNVVEFPQIAHVQFDRGRVTVVLQIQPSQTWGGSSGNPSKTQLHQQMLIGIATGLEMFIGQGVPYQQATAALDLAEQAAIDAAQRRRRRVIVVAVVIAALFATAIGIIVAAG